MPKRKKNPRLPSGWGSIRYLGKGRTLPYAVHPPATQRDAKGHYIRPSAICYVPDWYTGFGVLSAYHAGTYTPGLELTISREVQQSSMDLDAFCKRVLKDHGMSENLGSDCQTFRETYDQFVEWKFGENAPKKLSIAAKRLYVQGMIHLESVADKPIDRITLEDLQRCVNDCDLGKQTRSRIITTARAVYKYALPRHICEEDVSKALVLPDARENVSGVPFTEKDLEVFWADKADPTAEMLLIMCYSGFRISAFLSLEVNMDDWYFKGGVKTAAGKGRIVPIHSAIRPLVERRMQDYKCLLPMVDCTFRNAMYEYLDAHGMTGEPRHTPHDCRHTFSMLCEKYGVRESDRKRMMGHSFGADITNQVYGHRTLEDLRAEIEKIQIPNLEKGK